VDQFADHHRAGVQELAIAKIIKGPDQMNDRSTTTEKASQGAVESCRQKAVYRPPTLSFYGQVAALTQNSTGCDNNDNVACAGTIGRQNKNSDRRMKEHIERVGTHAMGFGLYLFEYKQAYREQSGYGRQFGVMADEVEPVLPQAVSVGADGFKTVDYGMLGIRQPH
jgi:hypothetical protein